MSDTSHDVNIPHDTPTYVTRSNSPVPIFKSVDVSDHFKFDIKFL